MFATSSHHFLTVSTILGGFSSSHNWIFNHSYKFIWIIEPYEYHWVQIVLSKWVLLWWFFIWIVKFYLKNMCIYKWIIILVIIITVINLLDYYISIIQHNHHNNFCITHCITITITIIITIVDTTITSIPSSPRWPPSAASWRPLPAPRVAARHRRRRGRRCRFRSRGARRFWRRRLGPGEKGWKICWQRWKK